MRARDVLIAGIAVPLVVGVVLLQIEYSFFTRDTSELKAEAKQIVEKIEGHNVEPLDKTVVEPNVGELQPLLEVADKVYGTTARNTEFQRLVRLALDEKKPGFALLVADKMYGTTARNEQFVAIMNECLEWKRFDAALKAAELLYGTTARNEAFKKIIDAGMKLRPKISNPALQGTVTSELRPSAPAPEHER